MHNSTSTHATHVSSNNVLTNSILTPLFIGHTFLPSGFAQTNRPQRLKEVFILTFERGVPTLPRVALVSAQLSRSLSPPSSSFIYNFNETKKPRIRNCTVLNLLLSCTSPQKMSTPAVCLPAYHMLRTGVCLTCLRMDKAKQLPRNELKTPSSTWPKKGTHAHAGTRTTVDTKTQKSSRLTS